MFVRDLNKYLKIILGIKDLRLRKKKNNNTFLHVNK